MKTGSFTGTYSDVMAIIQQYDVILEIRAGIPILIPKTEDGFGMCMMRLIECSNVFKIPRSLYKSYDSAKVNKLKYAHDQVRRQKVLM